ncbi:MAG: restriction endonuclease subunit S [Candidatus Bathyarchaeota archaeon]|nr:restriction endonuclease subunit S [Candidatus Bathyarchaeota archaeon]
MTVPLSELSQDFSLRSDPNFIKGVRELDNFTSSSKISFIKLAGVLSEKPRNGKNTGQSSYSMSPTDFVYLSVNDVKEGYIDLSDPIFLNDSVGYELEEYKLTDGDIVITRSGTVGVTYLYQEGNNKGILIPSGYLIIIRVDESKIDPQFLVEYFNSPLIKYFFETYSCGKNTRNISQENLKKIPIPNFSLDRQTEILEELQKFENKAEATKQSIPNTQDVIEKTFCDLFDYISFEEYTKRWKPHFSQEFASFRNHRYLRAGPRYHSFWSCYNGLIFISKRKLAISRIGNLIRIYKPKIFKKGYLTDKYILIDKEDVEPRTGIILNEEYVEKIGSDKILFGNCDLLISKIDPFLGHVIINDKTKPYIGTTEFVPYIVNRDRANLFFMQYIFVSKDFLEISKNIMAGKRQPRITPYELANLKIPLPKLEQQENAVEIIRAQIGTVEGSKKKLEQIRREKSSWFMEYLAKGEKQLN